MKRTFVFALGMIVCLNCSAYVPTTVKRLCFSTVGSDCYADGSPVLPGECYALVWQKSNTSFPGLPMDPPNPDNPAQNNIWVAEYFPVAEADAEYARCPSVSTYGFSIDDDANGKWTVYLLDTRYELEDGTVACGFDASKTNAPHRINAYVAIEGLTSFNIGTSPATPSGPTLTLTLTGGDLSDEARPMVANVPTADPPDSHLAAFSGVSVDAGVANVSLTNTVSYRQYELFMADTVDRLKSQTTRVGELRWGSGHGPLTWQIPVGTSPRKFFRFSALPR